MDKKKLSPKQIFRTIAFQYHQNQRISLTLLAEIVGGLYYPLDKTGQVRKRYELLLIHLLKQYSHQEKSMSEDQFIHFMNDMSKHSNQQYTVKTATRIFNRYQNSEGVIQEEGFAKMYQALKLDPNQTTSYFYNVADRKNQITLQKFIGFMNSMKKQ